VTHTRLVLGLLILLIAVALGLLFHPLFFALAILLVVVFV
jgi:hypothetical protein